MNPHMIGIFIGGLVAGCLCGLAPLIAGNRKGLQNLGTIGFIACAISGVILGVLLAGPVALVMTVVILTKKRE